MEASPSSYQFTIIFDIPTSIIVAVVLMMFFSLLYHIFNGLLFFWVMGQARWPHVEFDRERGILLPTDYTFSHMFHGLVQNNLQVWTMELVKQEIDEKRGQKLRDSRQLPPLVKYGCHEGAMDYDGECAVCLEGFAVGELCQVLSICHHIFHSTCIDRWLARKLTCPVCRTSAIG